jgi:hypothetical protein
MVVPMTGKHGSDTPATGNEVADYPQSRGPRLYSVISAAHELGVSERKIWTLLAAGRLRSVLLDGRRLIPAGSLDEFVSTLDVVPA